MVARLVDNGTRQRSALWACVIAVMIVSMILTHGYRHCCTLFGRAIVRIIGSVCRQGKASVQPPSRWPTNIKNRYGQFQQAKLLRRSSSATFLETSIIVSRAKRSDGQRTLSNVIPESTLPSAFRSLIERCPYLIIFASRKDVKRWLDVYGGAKPSNKLKLNNADIRFTGSMEPVDKFCLRAIKHYDDLIVDSDYDEQADTKPQRGRLLDLRRVDCGAFDEEDRFCVGWSKEAKSAASVVSFDFNSTTLRIRMEHDLVEAKLFDLDVVYLNRKEDTVYFVFKYPPNFLRDAVPDNVSDPDEWLNGELFDFGRSYNRFERLSAFDPQHRRCAQYAVVYRVALCNRSEVRSFFQSTRGRLFFQTKTTEKQDAAEDAFDVESMNSVLKKLSFELAYQAEALCAPHRLLPKDIVALSLDLRNLEQRLGAVDAAAAIRDLRHLPVERGPYANVKERKTTSLQTFREQMQCAMNDDGASKWQSKRQILMVHTARLTPSFGVRLEGPHVDEGNRILRRYVGFEKNFLRARVTDEDGSALRVKPDSGNIDSELMLEERYGDAMRQEGIMVAGRKFYFLAYGNSGLREGTCWFVRNFTMNSNRITAETIREDIGDLRHIRNPSRYAARMGQAFSTSSIAIKLDVRNVRTEPDRSTDDGKYDFTDGVGMVSQQIVDRVNEEIQLKRTLYHPITAFQIRMGGAKGMVALNPMLSGELVVLRKSMVKFPAVQGSVAIMEVSNYWPKPLPMFLNRQLITLLESLGVPSNIFLRLQRESVERLHEATLDPQQAIALYQHNGLGRAANINALINLLCAHGINAIRHVPFLHDVNISFTNFALRRVKYAARILISHSHTLVGVLDETGLLAPNQIVACIAASGEEAYHLQGACMITRSPALAPGDIQRTWAIEPPTYHPLRALTNVVIFSRNGSRPLFSMLSGGDLDGDLYNVIQHPDIQVKVTTSASEYERPKLREMDRQCTATDIANFFIDYLKLERLGILASRHLQLADQREHGALDSDCIKLAEMHSIAVDFAKTGLLPDKRQVPRGSRQKPDFMQKEYRLEDLREDVGRAKQHSRAWETFYPSDRALGLMFRAIDVYAQTKDWAQASELHSCIDEKDRNGESDWSKRIWTSLLSKGRASGWQGHLQLMRDRLCCYNRTIYAIAQDHCQEDKLGRLSEEEVFMGHILCRGPHGTRLSPYDTTKALQDDFEELCRSTRAFVFRDMDWSRLEGRLCDVVWTWLNFELDCKLEHGEIMKQLQKASQDGHETHIVLSLWPKHLRYAIQRGTAWIKAAFESTESRSAPWIMMASVLKAHQCCDCIEAFEQAEKDTANTVEGRDE